MRLTIVLFFVMLIHPVFAKEVKQGESSQNLHEASDEGSFSRPLVLRFGKYEQSFEWEATHPPPSCDDMTDIARRECMLVRSAQARINHVHLHIYREKKELRREFALVAYDKANDKWHDILLDMRVDLRYGNDVQVKTKGYVVTVLRGLALNQMVFQVLHDGEEFRVYAAKHLTIPVGTSRKSLLALKFKSEEVVYMATPDYLNLPEFEAKGRAYTLEHIHEALETLRALKVPSRAYPGRLVADVISDKLLLTVLAIEQSDPFRVFGVNYERILNGDSSQEVVSEVFVRFVLNGLRSYHYICSKKAACGGFQFTNGGKLGTYDMVRENYPTADIDPKFIRGSLSFINGAKAAALLLDLELANPQLPDFVRELYLKDSRFGALFPVAAYNGGASESMAFAKLYVKLEMKLGKPPKFDTIPWDWEPLVSSYQNKKGKPLKQETAVYLRKYQITSGLLY